MKNTSKGILAVLVMCLLGIASKPMPDKPLVTISNAFDILPGLAMEPSTGSTRYLQSLPKLFDIPVIALNAPAALMLPPNVTASADLIVNDYHQAAIAAAEKYGLPPALFLALVKHESSWRPDVVSSRGAVGLAQLLPNTAIAECQIDTQALLDPVQNLDCGAKYLSRLIQRFNSVEKGLCAYNAGPTLIGKLGRCPNYKITRHYVDNILTSWSAFL